MTSREDYLKAIFVLSKRMTVVRSVDLAHYLNYSKASVSRAVSLLSEEGYLLSDPDGLHLTETGSALAQQTYEKYHFFSDFLISLGVAPQTAHEDACRMEHAVSAESFDALKRRFLSGSDRPSCSGAQNSFPPSQTP